MTEDYRTSAEEDRSVLVVAFGRRVFGLERGDGTLRWEIAVGFLQSVELLIHAGRVYATEGTALLCVDYASGEELVRVAIPSPWKGRPSMVIEGGLLYVGGAGAVCCFTLDGDLVWTQPFKGKGIGSVALGFPDNLRQADNAK